MDGLIRLEVGKPYFYAAFDDKEMTVPVIETYVYVGFEIEDGHLFERVSSRSLTDQSRGPTQQLCFPSGVEGILDKKRLVEWLSAEHDPTTVGATYEYEAI